MFCQEIIFGGTYRIYLWPTVKLNSVIRDFFVIVYFYLRKFLSVVKFKKY